LNDSIATLSEHVAQSNAQANGKTDKVKVPV
jgi:hypothetical protein